MKQVYFFYTLLIVALSGKTQATLLTVPATYSSIQAAINAAANGDTVLVAPGTYYENLNFRGKNIVVTSQFYQSQNPSIIHTTIINGSSPVYQDTASCVIFNHNESSSAVLQGFTITGGKGTKWLDIHGAGIFCEGGGILIEQASPTIRMNVITNNSVTNTSGVVSTGGGGIRVGDGNPLICSNSISYNYARYGGGIVLNYTGAKVTNNVITSNSGGQQFNGGSGIWAIEESSLAAVYIENNTIVNNSAPNSGGTAGLYIAGCSSASVRNNIIYGNWPALQAKIVSSTVTVNYNDIQGGYPGTGNINLDPLFGANNYYLSSGSPCIDAGDPSSVYNDLPDPLTPGNALSPSQGTTVNDMGAYGGPCTSEPPYYATITGIDHTPKQITDGDVFPNPFSHKATLCFYLDKKQKVRLTILNILGEAFELSHQELSSGTNAFEIDGRDLPAGTYFVNGEGSEGFHVCRKIIITEK